MALLTESELRRGVRILARRDPDLARIFREYGYPPLWARSPGFPTLVHIILEQQVSLASAQAAFVRGRVRRYPRLGDAGRLVAGELHACGG